MIAHRVIRPKIAPTAKKVLGARPAGWNKKYKSPTEDSDIVAQWYKGQDFYSVFTSYFSIRNSAMLKKEGYTHILIDGKEVALV